MKAFSILEIPEYVQKEMVKNILGVNVDYRRYNFSDREQMYPFCDEYLMMYHKAVDTNNSNVVYDEGIAIVRQASPRGVAYQVIIAIEGIGPVPIIYFEFYKPEVTEQMQGAVGRFDYYGAFFHFRKNIPVKFLEMYIRMSEQIRSTRADICIDIAMKFPQNVVNWIKPSSNSKRKLQVYYGTHGKIQTASYLSKGNSGYGVRIYNKAEAIKDMGKQGWYGGEGMYEENWIRIEFEFYPPYSVKNDYELMKLVVKKILNREDVNLGFSYRPHTKFVVQDAYNYFSRYAKSRGISLPKLLEELTYYHEQIPDPRYPM